MSRESDSEPSSSGTDPAGDAWIERTLRYAAEEAQAHRPASQVMVARLAELLYVAVLRRFAEEGPPADQSGRFAAARAVEVGRALRLLHAHPERSWTAASLARAVGVSRSSLAQRFSMMVGESPMRYLAAWRVQVAKQLLEQPALSVAQVANRVGYGSDVAFHRAFRRHVGEPPAAWRSRRLAAPFTPAVAARPARSPVPSG